jgi:hypothetical protein
MLHTPKELVKANILACPCRKLNPFGNRRRSDDLAVYASWIPDITG